MIKVTIDICWKKYLFIQIDEIPLQWPKIGKKSVIWFMFEVEGGLTIRQVKLKYLQLDNFCIIHAVSFIRNTL